MLVLKVDKKKKKLNLKNMEVTHGSFDVIISSISQFVAQTFGQHSESLFRCIVHLIARIYRIRMARYAENHQTSTY